MGNTPSALEPSSSSNFTVGEKEEVKDSGVAEWLSGLSDRHNPSRGAIVDILCRAVFDSTSLDVEFNELKNALLSGCDDSEAKLSMMVVNKFLDGQCPIVWAICNFPSSLFASSLPKLPSVLDTLLKCYRNEWHKNKILVRDAHAACCIRDSNSLFQLLNLEVGISSQSRSPLYTIARAAVQSPFEGKFQFCIDNFPSRMLVDGMVDLQFVCESRLYSVSFQVNSSNNSWWVGLRVLQDHPKNPGFWNIRVRMVTLHLKPHPQVEPSQEHMARWEWLTSSGRTGNSADLKAAEMLKTA